MFFGLPADNPAYRGKEGQGKAAVRQQYPLTATRCSLIKKGSRTTAATVIRPGTVR